MLHYSDQYCTLIVVSPPNSSTLFLDSGSNTCKKDYTNIKKVLDDALNMYYHRTGKLKREHIRGGKRVFGHLTEFACSKQPENSPREAFYAIHHMRQYIRDERLLRMPSDIAKFAKDYANCSQEDLRREFNRIQWRLAGLVCDDVHSKDGLFYNGPVKLPNTEIENRLDLQRDFRDFMTLEGVRPFPPWKNDGH